MKKFIIAIALVAAALGAHAQALKIGTGGATGSYSRTFKELVSVCAGDLQLAEVPSSGSMQNIDRIIGNEISGGYAQVDSLHWRARTEDLSNIKTLVTLFPEQVHIVTLRDGKKEGGVLGMGAKSVSVNTLSDLNGRVVVAAGGSFITAQVIRMQTEVGFNVAEVADNKVAIAAVESGQATAAIIVGGAPMDFIKALPQTFKLVGVSEADVAKLKNVYKPASLTYQNVQAAGVKTVSTDSALVVREYKSAKFVEGLAKLRACFNAKVPELAEQPGMHAAWSKVVIGAESKWPMMVLPTVAVKK